MPKYRLLNNYELKQFEKEFIDYLVLNGIDAQSWENIKSEEKDKAERIIELFSDVVFEKIMRKTKYLFNYGTNTAFVLKFLEDKAQLFTLHLYGKSIIEASEKWLIRFVKKNRQAVQIYFQEKAYGEQREREIFKLMESGAFVAEGQLFEYLLEIQSN